MKISGTTGIDLAGLPINNSGNAEVEGLLTVGGNVGIGVANGDIFSRGYGKVLGISSSSVSAIELNSATGNSSFLDMGVNSTRVLSLSADASGANITTLGALPLFLNTNGTTRATLDANGKFTLNSPTGGLGYGTGAGVTVTQLTSKSTAVTLNKPTGFIAMSNSVLAAGASVTFTLNNTSLQIHDRLVVNGIWAYVNPQSYRIECAGVCDNIGAIRVTNVTAGSLSEAIEIEFSIIKGALS